jgi:hypothetical protein
MDDETRTGKTSDSAKLLAFLKGEKLSELITTVSIKVVLALAIQLLWLNKASETGYGFLGNLMMICLFYAIFSLFGFALKVTRNYLIAIIGTVLLAFGAAWLMDVVNNALGGGAVITNIILCLGFLSPFALDTTKIVRLVRIK